MADYNEQESGWQTMESDPAVFSELLKTLGVPLIVDDLYSLDSEVLAALQPLHALIFLFKWVGGTDETGGGAGAYDESFPGFFANQVVNNACATIAVLNGVCNIPTVTMGTELSDIISFSAGMDPQTLGEVVTSSHFLRTAHNSLSPPSSISLDGLGPKPRSSEDAYHFVVFIPHAGCIYELDGLKRAPVRHGEYTEEGEGWVGKARSVIENRIATYPPGSLHFNLLALRTDPLPNLERQLAEYTSSNQTEPAAHVREEIAIEKAKRSRWAFENSLRRHNHFGLIQALLQGLAKTGGLESAIESAKEKKKARIAAGRDSMEED